MNYVNIGGSPTENGIHRQPSYIVCTAVSENWVANLITGYVDCELVFVYKIVITKQLPRDKMR